MSSLIKQVQNSGMKNVEIIISQNTPAGWRLSTELSKLKITKAAKIKVTINRGVIIGLMTFDSMPAKSKLTVINNGQIIGAQNSGTALITRVKMNLTNNGTIAGGGGAGGYGGSGRHGGLNGNYQCASQGLGGGSGGTGAGLAGTTIYPATGGGSGYGAGDSAARSGNGGPGGGLGQPGGDGGPGYAGNSWNQGRNLPTPPPDGPPQYYPPCGSYNEGVYSYGGSGGRAGYYVEGNSFIEWAATGTRLGGYTA